MSDAKMAQQMQAAQAQQEKMKAMKEKRDAAIKSLLTTEAFERLQRIGLVKAQTAQRVGDMILKMAGQGTFKGKVTEHMLKDFLSQMTEKTQPKTKITFVRRRAGMDSDSDSENYDDL